MENILKQRSRVEIIGGREVLIITADEGYIYERIKDGLQMGNEIWLGVDFSINPPQKDIAENYREIPEPKQEPGIM